MGYCLPKALAPSVVAGAGGGGRNSDKNIERSVYLGERYYRKSSIKPPGGLIFFPSTFEGGGGLKREGGLI